MDIQSLNQLYQTRPDLFNEDEVDALASANISAGNKFVRNYGSSDTNLFRSIGVSLASFAEGFSTIPFTRYLDLEPRNSVEQIAAGIGHLAGFVGWFPGVGTAGKLAGMGLAKLGGRVFKEGSKLALASSKLAGKQVITSAPMAVSNFAMKYVNRGLDAAAKSGIKFLAQDNVKRHIIGDALHLGIASAAGSAPLWEVQAKDRLVGLVEGGLFGAGSSYLGNTIRAGGKFDIAKNVFGLEKPPKTASIGELEKYALKEKRINASARALSGAIFLGLPVNMAYDQPFEMDVYNFLLNGFFGYRELSVPQKQARKIMHDLSREEMGRFIMRSPEKVREKFPGRSEEVYDEIEAQAALDYGRVWFPMAQKADEMIGKTMEEMESQGFSTGSPETDAQYAQMLVLQNLYKQMPKEQADQIFRTRKILYETEEEILKEAEKADLTPEKEGEIFERVFNKNLEFALQERERAIAGMQTVEPERALADYNTDPLMEDYKSLGLMYVKPHFKKLAVELAKIRKEGDIDAIEKELVKAAKDSDFNTFFQRVAESLGKPTAAKAEPDLTPVESIPMKFRDGDRGLKMRPEFTGKSTMDLILSGDRTGTTRDFSKAYNVPKSKVGDIVEFYDDKGVKVKVRITSEPIPLKDIDRETWSKREGWSPEGYDALIGKGDWRQFTYELLKSPEVESTPVKQLTKVIEGDIWESGGIPVIPTNLRGVHGAGLANQAFKRGKIQYNKNGTFKDRGDVVTFPVKKVWSDKADIDLMKESAEQLIALANANPKKQYTLPLVGLGHGEGALADIKPIIDNILAKTENVKLILPKETTDLGKQGTARTDATKANLQALREAFMGKAVETMAEAPKAPQPLPNAEIQVSEKKFSNAYKQKLYESGVSEDTINDLQIAWREAKKTRATIYDLGGNGERVFLVPERDNRGKLTVEYRMVPQSFQRAGIEGIGYVKYRGGNELHRMSFEPKSEGYVDDATAAKRSLLTFDAKGEMIYLGIKDKGVYVTGKYLLPGLTIEQSKEVLKKHGVDTETEVWADELKRFKEAVGDKPNAEEVFWRNAANRSEYIVRLNGNLIYPQYKKGFMYSAKDFNKRAQVLTASDSPAEVAHFTENLNDLSNGKFRYVIFKINPENLPDNIKELIRYRNEGDTKDSYSEFPWDGNEISRQDVFDLAREDAGISSKADFLKGTSDWTDENGLHIDKRGIFRARTKIDKWMKDNKIHFIKFTTTAKSYGASEPTEVTIDENGYKPITELKVYEQPIESLRYNLTTKQPVKDKKVNLYKQLIMNVHDETTAEILYEQVLMKKVKGNKETNMKFKAFMDLYAIYERTADPKDYDKAAKYLDNINPDDLGYSQLLSMLGMGGKIYGPAMKKIRDYLLKPDAEPTFDEEFGEVMDVTQYQAPDMEIENFIAQMPADAFNLHIPGLGRYLQGILRNKILNKFVRVEIPYSMKNVSGGGSLDVLQDYAIKQGEYMLGEGAKDMPVYDALTGKEITLGEMYELYNASEGITKGKYADMLEHLVIRAPMDSPAGTRVLKFKGFIEGQHGRSIYLNSEDAFFMGGADNDGDAFSIFTRMAGKGEEDIAMPALKKYFNSKKDMWKNEKGELKPFKTTEELYDRENENPNINKGIEGTLSPNAMIDLHTYAAEANKELGIKLSLGDNFLAAMRANKEMEFKIIRETEVLDEETGAPKIKTIVLKGVVDVNQQNVGKVEKIKADVVNISADAADGHKVKKSDEVRDLLYEEGLKNFTIKTEEGKEKTFKSYNELKAQYPDAKMIIVREPGVYSKLNGAMNGYGSEFDGETGKSRRVNLDIFQSLEKFADYSDEDIANPYFKLLTELGRRAENLRYDYEKWAGAGIDGLLDSFNSLFRRGPERDKEGKVIKMHLPSAEAPEILAYLGKDRVRRGARIPRYRDSEWAENTKAEILFQDIADVASFINITKATKAFLKAGGTAEQAKAIRNQIANIKAMFITTAGKQKTDAESFTNFANQAREYYKTLWEVDSKGNIVRTKESALADAYMLTTWNFPSPKLDTDIARRLSKLKGREAGIEKTIKEITKRLESGKLSEKQTAKRKEVKAELEETLEEIKQELEDTRKFQRDYPKKSKFWNKVLYPGVLSTKSVNDFGKAVMDVLTLSRSRKVSEEELKALFKEEQVSNILKEEELIKIDPEKAVTVPKNRIVFKEFKEDFLKRAIEKQIPPQDFGSFNSEMTRLQANLEKYPQMLEFYPDMFKKITGTTPDAATFQDIIKFNDFLDKPAFEMTRSMYFISPEEIGERTDFIDITKRKEMIRVVDEKGVRYEPGIVSMGIAKFLYRIGDGMSREVSKKTQKLTEQLRIDKISLLMQQLAKVSSDRKDSGMIKLVDDLKAAMLEYYKTPEGEIITPKDSKIYGNMFKAAYAKFAEAYKDKDGNWLEVEINRNGKVKKEKIIDVVHELVELNRGWWSDAFDFYIMGKGNEHLIRRIGKYIDVDGTLADIITRWERGEGGSIEDYRGAEFAREITWYQGMENRLTVTVKSKDGEGKIVEKEIPLYAFDYATLPPEFSIRGYKKGQIVKKEEFLEDMFGKDSKGERLVKRYLESYGRTKDINSNKTQEERIRNLYIKNRLIDDFIKEYPQMAFQPTSKLQSYFFHTNFDEEVIANVIKRKLGDKIIEGATKEQALQEYAAIKNDMLQDQMSDGGLYEEAIAHVLAGNPFKRPGEGTPQAPSALKARSKEPLPGWDTSDKVRDDYTTKMVNSYYRMIFSVASTRALNRIKPMVAASKDGNTVPGKVTPQFFELLRNYQRQVLGYPSYLDDAVTKDPSYKIKPHYYFSDEFGLKLYSKIKKKLNIKYDITKESLAKKINEAQDEIAKLTTGENAIPETSLKVIALKKKIAALEAMQPGEQKMTVDLDSQIGRDIFGQKLAHFSTWEGKWNMVTLLATPQVVPANLLSANINTVVETGFKPWMDAGNLKILQRMNPEWTTWEAVDRSIEEVGGLESFYKDVFALGNYKEQGIANAMKEALSAIKDKNLSDLQLKSIFKKHGVADDIFEKSAWFMRKSERIARRKAWLAGYLKAREVFNASGDAFDWNDPIFINFANKVVANTQFIYNAANRPEFMATSIGKILTRFQAYTFNSLKWRKNIFKEAASRGFREHTPEYERFRRLMTADLFMISLATLFPISLFEYGIPTPLNQFNDMIDFLFGDEEKKKKAFFGVLPYPANIVQPVLPPSFRYLSSVISLASGDNEALARTAWTLFPFGRFARSTYRTIQSPLRVVENFTAFPLARVHKYFTEDPESRYGFEYGDDDSGQY